MIDRPPASPVAEPASPPRDERKAGEALVSFEAWMALGIAAPRLPVLLDGSPPDASAHPIPAQARIFNEDGFFGETRTIQAGEPASPPNMRAARPADGMPPVEPVATDAGADGALPLATVSLGAARTPARFVVPGTAPVSIGRDAAPHSIGGEHPAAPVIELPVEPPPLADAETIPAGPPDQRSRTARAQSLLSIAIRDIERGLHVRVTAQALSREERERLANEIAALLSRHGLTPRDVLIAAPIPNRNSGKK